MDDLICAVKLSYRYGKGKLENLKAKSRADVLRRLVELDSDIGREELLGRLKRYLADDSPWLVRHRWPIRLFLKYPERWAARDKPPVRKQRSPLKLEVNRNRIMADWRDVNYYFEAVASQDELDQIISENRFEWNPEWDRALSDSFVERRIALMAKASVIISSAWPKFGRRMELDWLFRKESRLYNWERIAEGRLDWALSSSDGRVRENMRLAEVRDSYLNEARALKAKLLDLGWAWYLRSEACLREYAEYVRSMLPVHCLDLDCPHWTALSRSGYDLIWLFLDRCRVVLSEYRADEPCEAPVESRSSKFMALLGTLWGEPPVHEGRPEIITPWIWKSPWGDMPCYWRTPCESPAP